MTIVPAGQDESEKGFQHEQCSFDERHDVAARSEPQSGAADRACCRGNARPWSRSARRACRPSTIWRAVLLQADLDGALGEMAAVGGDPHGHRAVAFADHAVRAEPPSARTGSPVRITKLANMPGRSSCRVGDLGAHQQRCDVGSTVAPTAEILPANTRSGKAMTVTLTSWPTWNSGRRSR